MTRRKRPAPPPRQVPAFSPVPLRRRRDGWTPRRQADFIGYLAETRSVAEAARRVNMARETAYRLRERPGAESFAAAWDAALGAPWPATHRSRKVTGAELSQRAYFGVLKPLLYRGRYTGTARKSDNTALLRLVANPDAGDPYPFGKSRNPWAILCQPEEPDWWPREDSRAKE